MRALLLTSVLMLSGLHAVDARTAVRPAIHRLRGGEAQKLPGATYNALVEKGAANAKMSTPKLLHQAFMGGCYVAIGGVFALTVAGALPHLGADVQRFIIGLIFPVGLIFILQAAGQLMTGNFAIVTAALYEGEVTPVEALRSFGLTGLGNALGCGAIALAMQHAGLLKGGMADLVASIATKKCSGGLVPTLIKAVLCNWLVCLAVFLSTQSAALPGKVLGIWSCIPMFVSIGLEHSVANMFFLPFGKMGGAELTMMEIITKNILIVTLGNLIGGGLVLAGGMSYQFGALGK